MAIDLATIGRRLKEARQNCGISQEDAADALGIPRTAMVHIESGNRSISTLELASLAELYRCPIADLLEERVEEDDVLVTLHRLSGDAGPVVQREVARCVEICREGYNLEQVLGRRARTGPPAYEVSPPKLIADAVEQGEAIAREERRRLGLGHAPIPDMAELLSCEGIWASGVGLPDEMSGLFLHNASLGFVVLVNFDHSRGRKRFSYAHEYAHALFDRSRPVNVTSRRNSSELIEKRANSFAASFLIPKSGVELFLASLNKGAASRRNFRVYDVTSEEGAGEAERRTLASTQKVTYQDAALLAAHFGVSYQAAVYRLDDLGYVTRDEAKDLIAKLQEAETYLDALGKLDAVRGRPSAQDRELVGQVLPLVCEAFRREEISRGKLLELGKLLKVDQRKLATLV